MASGSSWSRFPPITRFAATRDRRDRQDDEFYAAEACIAGTGRPWVVMQAGPVDCCQDLPIEGTAAGYGPKPGPGTGWLFPHRWDNFHSPHFW